jgi:hypothetical protein
VKVRRRGEVIRLRLDPIETGLLVGLFDELAELVDSDTAAADAARQRLFPAGYLDDDAAEVEFRSLTELTLQTERSQRVQQCAADLAGTARELELTDETGRRWIQVLNDLRLVLGTRLDVTEDGGPDVDADDRAAGQLAVYYWLTAVQDSLVGALMK